MTPIPRERGAGALWAVGTVGMAMVCVSALSTVVIAQAGEAGVTEASVRAHMSLLAGDALNGRGSGTRDEWIAATYVASSLERLGIEPLGDGGTYVQEVPTARAEILGVTLRAGGAAIHLGRGLLVQSAGAASVKGPLMRYVPGVSIAPGAVVLAVGPVAPPAADVARATIVIALDGGSQASATAPDAPPTTAATARPWRVTVDATAFAALNGVADGDVVSLDVVTRPGRTWNVIGQIAGRSRTRGAEVVLLSAHLDHLGQRGATGDTIMNGADDNASGVTCVLELAAAFARGARPQRTIMFAWFGSEEAGGSGSRHFAEYPPVPLERIVANLNFEMIGRPDPKVPAGTLWLTGFERSTLGPRLAARGARLVADPHPDQGFFMRSDNYRFAVRGVVAHTVSSFGLHTDYHAASDDVSRIDFAHMTRAIRSMVEPVRWLANSSFTPAFLAGMRPASPSR